MSEREHKKTKRHRGSKDHELYLRNWTALENSCVVLIKGANSNGVGCDRDVAAYKTLFKGLTTFVFDGDNVNTRDICIHTVLQKIARQFKKIIVIYTGHGCNVSDSNFPTFSFGRQEGGGDRFYSTFALHRLCEKLGFVLSVVIVDCCNKPVVKDEQNMEGLLTVIGDIDLKPFTDNDLTELTDQRGHLLVASSPRGLVSYGYNNIGSAFSLTFIYYLVKGSGFTHSALKSQTLLAAYNFPQPILDGFIISIMRLREAPESLDDYIVKSDDPDIKLVSKLVDPEMVSKSVLPTPNYDDNY